MNNNTDILNKASEYLDTRASASQPYFVVFDDKSSLRALLGEFGTRVDEIWRISDYCYTGDSWPDTFQLCERLKSANGISIMLLGVGEYAQLAQDPQVIRQLFALSIPSHTRVIIPLWNGYDFYRKQLADPRIDTTRIVAFPKTGALWQLRQFPDGISPNSEVAGIKAILKQLENGYSGLLDVRTDAYFSSMQCRTLSPYESFCELYGASTEINQDLFNEQQWLDLLKNSSLREDTHLTSMGTLLRYKQIPPEDNQYLAYVVRKTQCYDEWRNNLSKAIFDFLPSADTFDMMYEQRKRLAEKFTNDVIHDYTKSILRYQSANERIAYLTNNTAIERLEIIRTIAEFGNLPNELSRSFPTLNDYLCCYHFHLENCTDFALQLTEYFQEYKLRKLFNKITWEFHNTVEKYARERPFNYLQHRDCLVESLDDGRTFLCWLDALGCEFLGYIQTRARAQGMTIRIQVARASLPSITTLNRAFYDTWSEDKKEYNNKLDNIKHGHFEDYGYSRTDFACELYAELDVIDALLRSIKEKLGYGKYNRVVIASDHGASRLAVIANDEILWDMTEAGKHSGRCCKASPDDREKPEFITSDSAGEWNVIANYDRIKGSRKGDVEVHGGASLEEVVVPVIELSLFDGTYRIENLTQKIKTKYSDRQIRLEVICTPALRKPCVQFDNTIYNANVDDMDDRGEKFTVTLPKPRADKYNATIYDDDTPIGEITFTVASAVAGMRENDFF